jgi:hypothetical protein
MSIPTDKLYPLFTKDLLERLSINSYDIKMYFMEIGLKEIENFTLKFHREKIQILSINIPIISSVIEANAK